MSHVNLRGDQNGVTFVTGANQQISFDTFLAVPINNGGQIDSTMFSLSGGGPWTTITILQPGIYWAEARCDWWRDWGAVRVNLLFSHTSGAVFPVSDSYGFSTSLATEPGGTFNPIGAEAHTQTAVARRGIIIIDEYATSVDLWAELSNTSGVNRTFNNTTNTGGAQLFVVRLSPGSHSDSATNPL